MHDLREVFELVTKQTEPDLDSWKKQEVRQRRTSRNRKLGAIGLVAALVMGLVVFALTRLPGGNGMPAKSVSVTPSVPVDATPPIGPQLMAPDGTPVQQLPPSIAGGLALALSPDGTTVAYMDITNGLRMVAVDGSDDRALTDRGSNSGDAMDHVSWSPEGSKVAYAWSGEIYVANADGSGRHRLTHSAPGTGSYYPAWSPDGSTIAYWSGSSTVVDGGPSDAEIYTIPASGGKPRQLTHDRAHNIEPAWSPDGTQIAFKHGWGLGEMNADGTGLHDIYSVKHGPWAPAWSPDGTAIAFTVFDPSERALDGGPLLQMRILTLASGKVTRLSVRAETDLNGPQWISDGEILINRYN